MMLQKTVRGRGIDGRETAGTEMNQDQRKKINYLRQRLKIPVLSTKKEFKDFIDQSMNNVESVVKQVNIGKVTDEARQRIKDIYGKSASNVDIRNNGVVHAHRKENHNLEPDDLLHAVDVINTTPNIIVSDLKHEDNNVLEFNKDINGEIKYLTEIHPKKDYLLVFDAMRKKKVNKRPDATLKSPPELTSKTNLLQTSKIVDPHRTGSNPGNAPINKSATVANPVSRVDQLSDPNIPQSAQKIKEGNDV